MSRFDFFLISIPFLLLSWFLGLAAHVVQIEALEDLQSARIFQLFHATGIVLYILLQIIFYRYCAVKRLAAAGRNPLQARYILTYIFLTAIFCIYFSLAARKD